MGIIEQNLETNTLLTHNNALEKILSTGGFWIHGAVTEFVWIPLVHALLTSLSQQKR